MLFSSKISNSFFAYLERNQLETQALESLIEVPEEFLRNPSSWLEAGRMEAFLFLCVKQYGDIIEAVGHSSPQLRAWGVLDGVLRMMTNPQDLFLQPERILSYFLSPQPQVRNFRKERDSVSFDSPFPRNQYPLTAQYILAALESLPVYMGRPQTSIKWTDKCIEVSLIENQTTLFGEEGPGHQYKPEFLQSLVGSLEKSQKELEERNRELIEKNNELLMAQKELSSKFRRQIYSEKLSHLSEVAAGLSHEVNNPLAYATSNVLRLSDYLARAQQLVTILIGQDRLNPQVKEAMRRMDWEFITQEYPVVVKEASQGLQRVRDIIKDLSFLAGPGETQVGEKTPTHLNELIDRAISSAKLPNGTRVLREFEGDALAPVYPSRLEQALVNLINNAGEAVTGSGRVRVATKIRGHLAHVEIEDDGVGMDEATLQNIFTPYFTTRTAGRGTGLGLSIVNAIVQMHDGRISVESEKGKGSKFTIELPL